MMRIHERLDVTDTTDGKVVGKHSIWFPSSRIKVPFQFGGRVVKYQHPAEDSYLRESIAEEYAFLQWLSSLSMAPPVGEWVYFKEVVSNHLAASGTWVDPLGAYGFEMEDATTLPPGRFSSGALRSSGMVVGSPGAWGDIAKDGNILNGYLVDVRRSWWDRLRYLGPIPPMPSYMADEPADIAEALRRDGAFPFRERDQAYQEFWLDGRWVPAEREVRNRAELLGFEPKPGETVVDLGCHTGGFLQFAALRGAGRLLGFDMAPEYLNLAKRLARANGMNICYRRADLSNPSRGEVARFLRAFGADHVLILSMEKHLGTHQILDWIRELDYARNIYIETNAIKDPSTYLQTAPFPLELAKLGAQHVGWSNDRNLRALFRIDR